MMTNYHTRNITKRPYANGYISDQADNDRRNALCGIISAAARSCVEPCDVTLLKKQLTGTATTLEIAMPI